MERTGGRTRNGSRDAGIEKRKTRGRVEKEETWSITFWNVAGIQNKDKDFWENLKRWDVILLTETWVEDKKWEELKNRLPKDYTWKIQKAGRKNKEGRAIGGILLGVKKNIEIIEVEEEEEEGKVTCKIKVGEEKWRIIGIYVNRDLEKKWEGGKKWMEEEEEGVKTIIGGDFNARTEEGGWRGEEEIEEIEGGERRSKDKKVNKGRKLIEFLEERGWFIFNGSIEGDEEGELTYTGGRGKTVIEK